MQSLAWHGRALRNDQTCSGTHSGTSVAGVDDAQRDVEVLLICTLGVAAEEPTFEYPLSHKILKVRLISRNTLTPLLTRRTPSCLWSVAAAAT